MRLKYQLRKNQNQESFKVHQKVKTTMRLYRNLNFDQEKIHQKKRKSKVKSMKKYGIPFWMKKSTDSMRKT